MELIALVLSIVACVGLAAAALIFRKVMPAYLTEKGKNLASKEDLAHLTSIVETVKSAHAVEIERLKASLATESQVMEHRRCAYNEMCGALRLFISGHKNSDEEKNKFHAAYAAAWLWASDDVVSSLNRFIVLQRKISEDSISVSQDQLKTSYAEVVLEMRKNLGFENKNIEAASYQFFQFKSTDA